MSDLTSGKVGPELGYAVKFEGGKLIATAIFDGSDADIDLSIKLDALKVVAALVDKLEEVIPGDQKMLSEMLKTALKGVMS